MLDSALTDILADCSVSLKLMAKTFFPNRFFRPFSPLHDEMFKILDDPSEQKVAIAGPRSVGKSSIIQLLIPMQKILFSLMHDRKSHHYIVPIQHSSKMCMQQTENLKRELEANEMIQKIFGPQKGSEWAKECWTTANGVMILPRGAEQQIRGLLFGNYRPDLILPDDLEHKLLVMNPENREKLRTWYFSDVEGCVDRGSKLWRIIHIGNIIHQDCLLNRLINKSDYTTLRLELCDDQYRSNWPEYMDDDACRALADTYRDKNALIEFFMDYRCIPLNKEDQDFKEEYFKYYDENELLIDETADVESIIIVDPAKKSEGEKGDDTAIICVGIDTARNRLYLRDCEAGRFTPDEMYKRTFAMAKRFGALVVGIEVTSLHDYIVYPIKAEMLRTGHIFTLVELKPFGGANLKGKNERIRSLIPFFRNGMWYFNKAISGALENQLLTWPRGAHDDIADALAYTVGMLSEGGRYFNRLQVGAATERTMIEELESIYGNDAARLYEAVLSRSYND